MERVINTDTDCLKSSNDTEVDWTVISVKCMATKQETPLAIQLPLTKMLTQLRLSLAFDKTTRTCLWAKERTDGLADITQKTSFSQQS